MGKDTQRRATPLGTVMAAVLVLLAVSSCGGGGGGGRPSVHPPQLSDLTFSPTHLYVGDGGGQVDIDSSVWFTDSGGDLASITIETLDEDGDVLDTVVIPAIGARGVTAGTLEATIPIDTTTTGDFTFRVFATDEGGSQSNALEDVCRIGEHPWIPREELPEYRRDHAVVALDGLIYVIGGADSSPSFYSTRVDIYDPVSSLWSLGSPLPVGVADPMVASANGRIYVLGGRIDGKPGGVIVDTVQEYDPVTETWLIKTSMPAPRWAGGAATHGDSVYVVAGIGEGGEDDYIGAVWRYDPAGDAWSIGPEMLTHRQRAMVVTMGDGILVHGGHSDLGGYLNTTERYDPDPGVWSSLASSTLSRASAAVVVHGGLMFEFCGQTGGAGWSNVSTAYDEVLDAWTPKTFSPMNFGGDDTWAVNIDGRIFVIDPDIVYEYVPSRDWL